MASLENTFLCSKCQKNIPIKEQTYHELCCLYGNNYNIDFTNLIPCEICDELINVEEYNDHISRCQIMIQRGGIRTINREMINTLRNRLEHIIRERTTDEELNSNSEIQIMDENMDDNTREDLEHEENEENEENSNDQQPIINRVFPNRVLLTEAITNIISEISDSNSQTQIVEGIRNYLNNSNVNSNIIINQLNPFDNNILNNNNISQINSLVTNIINNNINEVEPPNNSYEELTQISNRVGIVSVGIDNIDDVSTPIISLKSEICPICIQKENNLRLTLCNHTFCDLCLQKWLKDNNKCPFVCKTYWIY